MSGHYSQFPHSMIPALEDQGAKGWKLGQASPETLPSPSGPLWPLEAGMLLPGARGSGLGILEASISPGTIFG